MSFPVTEIEARLVKSGTVTLDSAGSGVVTLDPENARQRWEVTTIVVSTNQAATATVVPVATVAKNTLIASQLSQGNNGGQSWSGNQDTFAGKWEISPADYLSVIFAPPPGATNAQVASLAQYSGSVTTPGGFAIIATGPVLPAGTYTVQWAVGLSGTVGAADANGFILKLDPATNLAFSVNPGAAGYYPQAAVTFTTSGGHGLFVLSAAGPATSGAVYTGAMSGLPTGAGVTCYVTVTGSKFTRRA